MKGWRLANVGYDGWTVAVDTNRAGMVEAGDGGRWDVRPPDFGRIEGAATLLLAHPD